MILYIFVFFFYGFAANANLCNDLFQADVKNFLEELPDLRVVEINGLKFYINPRGLEAWLFVKDTPEEVAIQREKIINASARIRDGRTVFREKLIDMSREDIWMESFEGMDVLGLMRFPLKSNGLENTDNMILYDYLARLANEIHGIVR